MNPDQSEGLLKVGSVTVNGGTGDGSTDGFDPWTATAADLSRIPNLGQSAALTQWGIAQLLLDARASGELAGPTLLSAMAMRLRNDMTLPRWIREQYLEAFGRFERLEVGSLDEAFGVRGLNKRTREKYKLRWKLELPVYQSLRNAIAADPDQPLDKGLYEQVGAVIKKSGTYCDQLYRLAVRGGCQDLKDYKAELRAAKKVVATE